MEYQKTVDGIFLQNNANQKSLEEEEEDQELITTEPAATEVYGQLW